MANDVVALVEKATSHMLIDPDWETNVALCDIVNNDPAQAEDALRQLKKRLRHINPYVQLLALSVLDTLGKNCGDNVYPQILEYDVLSELVNIVKEKPNLSVKKKILILIGTWEGNGGPAGIYPQYRTAYHELKSAGVEFPPREQNSVPLFTAQAQQVVRSPRCIADLRDEEDLQSSLLALNDAFQLLVHHEHKMIAGQNDFTYLNEDNAFWLKNEDAESVDDNALYNIHWSLKDNSPENERQHVSSPLQRANSIQILPSNTEEVQSPSLLPSPPSKYDQKHELSDHNSRSPKQDIPVQRENSAEKLPSTTEEVQSPSLLPAPPSKYDKKGEFTDHQSGSPQYDMPVQGDNSAEKLPSTQEEVQFPETSMRKTELESRDICMIQNGFSLTTTEEVQSPSLLSAPPSKYDKKGEFTDHQSGSPEYDMLLEENFADKLLSTTEEFQSRETLARKIELAVALVRNKDALFVNRDTLMARRS